MRTSGVLLDLVANATALSSTTSENNYIEIVHLPVMAYDGHNEALLLHPDRFMTIKRSSY